MIRANVIWARFAPSPTATKKPKGFDAKNSNAYPAGAFAMLDSFVAGAQARGMSVLLTPTGPIPAWASRCKGSAKARSTCKPDPAAFGAFVRALGSRYPTVKAWSIWNEPNLGSWLSPQYAAVGSKAVLQSAKVYRALAVSAIAGLRATGHTAATDQILLGETAPVGDNPSTCSLERSSKARANCQNRIRKSSPETFARAVLCIGTNGKKLTGSASSEQGCGGFKKLAVTGYAHHPYTSTASFPPLTRVKARDITISVLSRLTKLLDQAGKAKRVNAALPVWLTEHGFQTNPPEEHNAIAVTDAQQAEYINQSDWIAYNNARVRTTAQYKIVDDQSIPAGFQTGLRLFNGGARKPSYDAYKLPIFVARKGSNVTVYGQARPADPGAAGNVEVQNASAPGAAFQTVATVPVTSANGTFTTELPNSGGVWRLRWNGLTSRQAEVAAK